MNNKKYVALSIAIGVVLVVIVVVTLWLSGVIWAKDLVQIDPQVYYSVTYVVDGDTFKADISGQIITVRVLGINTPETVDPRKPVECYGPEASKAGKELLTGHKVRLELNPNREVTDKYGRYLAYVYLDDGLFYNEEMIKQGYAKEYTVGTPYSLQAEFRAAQKEAKSAKRGLWGACLSGAKV